MLEWLCDYEGNSRLILKLRALVQVWMLTWGTLTRWTFWSHGEEEEIEAYDEWAFDTFRLRRVGRRWRLFRLDEEEREVEVGTFGVLRILVRAAKRSADEEW